VYVYYNAYGDNYAGFTNAELAAALVAAYAPLAEIGCDLIYGNGSEDFVDSGLFQTSSRQAIVPVSGATIQTLTWNTGSPSNPTVTAYIASYEAETDEYHAGELFLVVVQSSFGGIGDDGRFRSGAYGTQSPTLAGPLTSSGSVHRPAGDTTAYTVPDWMTEIESTEPYPLDPILPYDTLCYNETVLASELAAMELHAANYKKFQQKYYYPDMPIFTSNFAVDGGGALAYTTTASELYDLIAPPPYAHSSFPNGDASTLAAQIISDAVSFLS
jgi:hypothetical protein